MCLFATGQNQCFSKIKKKITYEYILLKDINDGLEDAKDLYNFTKHVPSKVNLIEYNLVDGLDYDKSSVEKVNLFIEYLDKIGEKDYFEKAIEGMVNEKNVKIMPINIDDLFCKEIDYPEDLEEVRRYIKNN